MTAGPIITYASGVTFLDALMPQGRAWDEAIGTRRITVGKVGRW